jgi:signal transduction histidine kinase
MAAAMAVATVAVTAEAAAVYSAILAKVAGPLRDKALFAVLFGALILAYALGGLSGLDNLLTASHFKLARSDASGDLALIEIDARSLEEIDSWPWPRSVHAGLVERLGDAGVRDIAIDVDFSARSPEAEEDLLLAEAIAGAARPVILPVFRQLSSRAGAEATVVRKGPIAELRGNALPGSVNVVADPDGVIRRHLSVEQWNGTPVASMAALLADAASGDGMATSFLVDYGIRAETIPVYSYADIYFGRVDLALLAGKTVLIGASAAELGSRFTVPVYGTVPGTLVHALAYESMTQGRMLHRLPMAVTAAIALLLGLGFLALCAVGDWRLSAALLVAGIAVIYGVSLAVQAFSPILVDGALMMLALVAAYLAALARDGRRQALRIFLQGMAIRHRRNMMDAVLEKNFHGIVITDGRGRVQFVNEAARRILALSGDAGLRRPIGDILPGAEAIESGLEMTEEAPVERSAAWPAREMQVRRADGETIALEAVVSESSVDIGESSLERRKEARTIRIYTFRDIGQRKLLEEAQKKALEEAVAAGRSKAEFLAIMSHELRTPLNAILGFSDILRNQVFGPIGKQQYLDYAEDIHQSGTSLLMLINDILNVSRVEAGKFNINNSLIDVAPQVEASMKLVRNAAAENSVTLHAEIAADVPRLRADERLVAQMMINLLSNAVKFSRKGGEIRVRAFIAEHGSYVIEVADDGIGIAQEDITKVLQPFQQADSSLGRKYEGSGLGLYLVSKFMDLHDGELRIESELGVGTKVALVFPPDRVVRAASGGGDGLRHAD